MLAEEIELSNSCLYIFPKTITSLLLIGFYLLFRSFFINYFYQNLIRNVYSLCTQIQTNIRKTMFNLYFTLSCKYLLKIISYFHCDLMCWYFLFSFNYFNSRPPPFNWVWDPLMGYGLKFKCHCSCLFPRVANAIPISFSLHVSQVLCLSLHEVWA